MKRILFTLLLATSVTLAYSQTTYYWVGSGSAAANANMNNGANWNTSLDGTGSARPSATGATDILVFDGLNLGGTTPITGAVTIAANAGITCGQILFVNDANVGMQRPSSGTTTITISGGDGDDFFVEAGAMFSVVPSTQGSIVFAIGAANTGRVDGAVSIVTPWQFGFRNTTGGSPGSFIFTNGSSLTTNITSGSTAYAFGNNSQSSPDWVVFEAGSHLYYEGGYSPHGSGAGFSAIVMKPGSVWHHRASNEGAGGNFFNRQGYGDIMVENNAALTAAGTIYRIENLTINAGSSFIPSASGQTVVTGNIIANGDFADPSGTNRLVLAGATQTVSGSGNFNVANLTIGDNADVTLNKSITVETDFDVYGKLNFGANQVSGNSTFAAAGTAASVPGTGDLVADRYFITGNSVYGSSSIGKTISGAGIAPNTTIVSFSITLDSIYLSQPLQTSGTGVALSATNTAATLATANTNGFDPASGSVITGGDKTYGDGINYIINAATVTPFGITTGSSGNMRLIGFAEINAAVTANTGFRIDDYLALNGKLTLRPLDLLHINTGASITGTFGAASYIATDYNSSNGDQSLVQYDGLATATILPVGTVNYYLPVTITPSVSSDFTVAVFEGITLEGTITGTAFTPVQKQTVVDAVWNINRLNGSGDASVQLGWDAALEGSTFTTLPDSDIGLIQNTGLWGDPLAAGDNTANTASAVVSSFGAFGAGAVPQVDPFVFNPLPEKTYGDPDFNGGATSLNTTESIVYISSNPAVATIVNGDIHITGAGTADITASQESDGFYPAVSVTQPLVVHKASLEIKADDQLKFEGLPNPALTATYTGFVYAETPAALLTPAVLSTTAEATSPPGAYPITVSGATSDNYTITFTDGVLSIQPKQNQTITFPGLATKTYGNADFSAGVTSTNSTIPVTYTSSNTSVATVNSSGMIHITGAGTTTITASQAGNDGYFPATPVERVLTVNKANLTIRALDTTKVQGTPNPDFIITYSGFVLGENSGNLTALPVVSTTAGINSSPGNYALVPEEAQSQNYNFIYTSGRLTILPAAGTDQKYLVAFYSGNGNLTVRVYSPEPSLGDIVVYDINGRPVARRNIFMPEGFAQVEVYIPSLASGMYVVTVKGEGTDLRKLIQIIK